MRCLQAVLVGFGLCVCSVVHAHPETLLQIAMLTEEISSTSNSGELLVRRGELYLEHDDTTAALADFSSVLRLQEGPSSPGSPGNRAARDLVALHLRLGNVDCALKIANELVERWAEDPEAWLTRAAVHEKARRYEAAADDLKHVCELSPQPDPDWYRRRAKAHLSMHTSQTTQAVSVLEEGMRRLGPLITLNELALEIEELAGKYEAALQRVSGLIKSSPRPERWLVRKGDILRAAGRQQEAAAAYQESANLIALLPPQLRNTTSTMALARRAESGISGEAEWKQE